MSDPESESATESDVGVGECSDGHLWGWRAICGVFGRICRTRIAVRRWVGDERLSSREVTSVSAVVASCVRQNVVRVIVGQPLLNGPGQVAGDLSDEHRCLFEDVAAHVDGGSMWKCRCPSGVASTVRVDDQVGRQWRCHVLEGHVVVERSRTQIGVCWHRAVVEVCVRAVCSQPSSGSWRVESPSHRHLAHPRWSQPLALEPELPELTRSWHVESPNHHHLAHPRQNPPLANKPELREQAQLEHWAWVDHPSRR